MNYDIAEYMEFVRRTGVYPRKDQREALGYLCTALAGEVGEVCNVAKKWLRDDQGEIPPNKMRELCLELGDVLWYTFALCEQLDLDIYSVMQANIEKLTTRRQAGGRVG